MSHRLPKVMLPEPFLHYHCNLKGCCCGGWSITWTADDLARLMLRLPRQEMEDFTREQLQLLFAADGVTVEGARLKASEPGQHCRFLEPAGRCQLQARFGVGGLPGICVDFPVVPYAMVDRLELSYRMTCPEVLRCIFLDPGPVRWIELADPDPMFTSRLQRIGPTPELSLDRQPISATQLGQLRDRITTALDESQLPTLELLSAIETGLAGLHTPTDLPEYRPRVPDSPLPFVRYLLHCVRTHSALFLVDNYQRYRKFLFENELTFTEEAFQDALEHWESALARWIEPAEPQLRPYLRRYLWLRYATCFVHIQGELLYSFGEVTHELAIGLRYLSALCEVTGQPPDLRTLFCALGAAAHLFHSHGFPFHSRIWFNPEHFQDDQPPPPQVSPTLEAQYVRQDTSPLV